MHNHNLDAARHARARGLILEALSRQHPNPVDFAVLRRHLDTFGYPTTRQGLASYCIYLRDEGYVTIAEKGFGAAAFWFLVITPKGLNLVDGYTTDPGIDTGAGC